MGMPPPPLRGYGWTYKPDPPPNGIERGARFHRTVLIVGLVVGGAWALAWAIL